MDAVVIALAIAAVFALGAAIEWSWHRRHLVLDHLPQRQPKPLTRDEQDVVDWLRSLAEEEPPPEAVERMRVEVQRAARLHAATYAARHRNERSRP